MTRAMNMTSLYKKTVPKSVREWIAGLPAVQDWRNRKLVEEGKRFAAGLRDNQKRNGRIHVALMETRQGFWLNHASIYEAMRSDGSFDVQVFAVPKRSPAGDMNWSAYRQLIHFLGEEGIPCVQAYDMAKRKWNNPLSFGLPDVIFLSQPYDFQQNFMYGSSYWSRFCQVAFVDYGFTVDESSFIFKAPCLDNCRYIFCETETVRNLFCIYSPEHESKLVVTGHPSLDAYLQPLKESRRIPFKSVGSTRRIVWAPHFTVASEKTGHHFSNFFEYYELFIQLAKAHPELEIVMRPHPALFNFMVDCGMKTAREAQEYRERFEALPNAFIYDAPDYISLFRQSDAILLDSISFIAACAPAGIPVCFLESSKRARLNSIGERLLHADYAAWDAEEIREFVERVVIGGDDYKKEERAAVVKKLIYIPPEGAGARIAREIKTRLLAERKAGTTHGPEWKDGVAK